MKELAIIGAGGHAKEVASYFYNSKTFPLVDKYTFFTEPGFVKDGVISTDNFDPNKYVAIVAVGNPNLRERLVKKVLPPNTEYATIIHNSSVIGRNVKISPGCLIAPGCILTTDIILGEHCHINVHCSISHDCRIEDYCTISPGARILGNVYIKNNVFVGANSVIREKTFIPSNITLGINTGVVNELNESNSVYIGTPAKKLR